MKITGKVTAINGPTADPIKSGDLCLADVQFQWPTTDSDARTAIVRLPGTAWVDDEFTFLNIGVSGEFRVGDGLNIEISEVAKQPTT